MMKRILIILLIIVLMAFFEIAYGVALVNASDTDNAEYLTVIKTTNNGTALTDTVAVFSLNTTAMIAGGMLDSSALKAAMTTGTGGTDLPFMPGYGSDNWCVMLPSIGASSSVYSYLYTNNVTGGNEVYFPDSNGFNVEDDSSLEIGANFTVSMTGYFDPTYAGTSFIFYKSGAFRVYTNSGNITAYLGAGALFLNSGNITSGYQNIKVSADSTNFYLFIDDGLVASSSLGGVSAGDNSYNWTIAGGGLYYMESANITIGGTLRGSWKYNYGPNLIDASGYGNNATITTFRTNPSDIDVSAVVVSQEGLRAASTPTSSSDSGWTMITAVPSTPAGLFSEGADTYGIGSLDIGQKITDTADAAGQDPTAWHIMFVFAVSLLILFGVYKITHNTKMGQRGSLLLAVMGAEGILTFFYVQGTIPGLALIPFGLIALLLIVWRKSPAPVD